MKYYSFGKGTSGPQVHPQISQLESWGECSRSNLNYFEHESDFEFSRIIHVRYIYFIYCSKLYCTVGGIMKSVMENALKSMEVSLLV